MRIRNIYLFISIMLILFPAYLAGREWPDDTSYVQTAFAASVGSNFSRGVGFRSDGQRVSSWSDGEVIWVSESSIGLENVPGEGLVVIEHEDGFRSSYRGIESRPELSDEVSRGDWLGYAGEERWIFEIADSEKFRIVNPISLLPSRTDTPVLPIDRVELTRGASPLELKDGMDLNPGRWTVVIHDSAAGNGQAIPLEISLYWVGERIGNIRFDALAYSEEAVVLEMPEQKEYKQIYNRNGQIWFPDVLLNSGRGTLELRIRDETDRVISKSWGLSVR